MAWANGSGHCVVKVEKSKIGWKDFNNGRVFHKSQIKKLKILKYEIYKNFKKRMIFSIFSNISKNSFLGKFVNIELIYLFSKG